MNVTRLAGLHPVTYPDDDDTQPSLRGKPIMRQFKVRFSTPQVAPCELPNFPYVATFLGAHEIIYTAIIEANNLHDIEDMLERTFEKPVIVRIEVDCNTIDPDDVLAGSQPRGVIPATKKKGWFRSLIG